MTFYTDDVWDNLEVSGKAAMSTTVLIDIDDFISRLYDEARDYSVSLSVKLTYNSLYVYLRKNRS